MRSEIEAKILRLSFLTVCNALFLKLCPGYSSQPHAAIDHIRQIHTDRDGNQVASMGQAYFQQLMGAARPFSSQQDFPVSVCAKFQEGLDPRLQTGFWWYFPAHSIWKQLATSRGVPIGDTMNTRIIISNIISWLSLEDYALEYIRCQLKVCQAYRLSLNLHKSHFIPAHFEFIGIDICANGNRPAKSKHSLLLAWPAPEFVRNVAKFIGFCQFYSCFIHHFELRIAPLRKLTKHEYTNPIKPLWTDAAQAAWEDMRTAIVSDPCLK
jgi:hypothetical protein